MTWDDYNLMPDLDASALSKIAAEKALHNAIEINDLDLVSKAISRGVDLNAYLDCDGWTALHYATVNNKKKIATLLLESGADIMAKTKIGSTPLHLAASAESPEMVFFLTQNGARTVETDDAGQTALNIAFSLGSYQCVQILQAAALQQEIEKIVDVSGMSQSRQRDKHGSRL